MYFRESENTAIEMSLNQGHLVQPSHPLREVEAKRDREQRHVPKLSLFSSVCASADGSWKWGCQDGSAYIVCVIM